MPIASFAGADSFDWSVDAERSRYTLIARVAQTESSITTFAAGGDVGVIVNNERAILSSLHLKVCINVANPFSQTFDLL